MLKKILIGLGVLIAAVLLIGFMMPRQMELTESISIDAPTGYVFEEINDLKKGADWSYWTDLYKDDMTMTYGDITEGVGAVAEWNGEESGKGKMTIVESTPDKSISMDLDFMEQGTGKSWYTFESEGEGTRLTTGFSTDFGMNPIGRLMGTFLMKGEMEKSLDYELKRLKEIAEAKPKFTIEISEENIQPISYVGQRTTMSIEDLGAIRAQMGKSFGDLMAVLGRAKESMTGAPMCLYPMYDEGQKKMEMICALPVNGDAKLPAKYAIQQTTGGKAAKGISMGAYSKLANAHEQINGYIAMKNLKRNGIPYEAYITDPMAEPDTTKWITEIYYPVK